MECCLIDCLNRNEFGHSACAAFGSSGISSSSKQQVAAAAAISKQQQKQQAASKQAASDSQHRIKKTPNWPKADAFWKSSGN
jgi:hypothetical protein